MDFEITFLKHRSAFSFLSYRTGFSGLDDSVKIEIIIVLVSNYKVVRTCMAHDKSFAIGPFWLGLTLL